MLHRALAQGSAAVHKGLGYVRQWAETRCPACYHPIVADKHAPVAYGLCPACTAQLSPYTGACCPLCGLPHVDGTGPSVPCAHCLASPPLWSAVAFHGLYRRNLQSLLLRLKYHADFALIPVLASMLCHCAATLPPCDVVLSMPQYPSHLYARGFNQAHELAKIVARSVALPLNSRMLVRTRQPLSQTGLSAKERWDNPKHSFAAHGVQGLRILLVDDTMTTGSTLYHATQTVLEQGATSVAVAVVARTPPPTMEGARIAHDKQAFFV